ncbi:MAG: hypothetical protein WD534_16615 [Phycisphaeraceae bacterium]
MRIELRNERRQRLYAVHVDLEDPPTVVRSPDALGPTVHLDWDRALDDEHHLRRCPACGCGELFARKRMPQVTGFVLILLAAVVAMVLFGIGEPGLAVLVLLLVLGVDVMIFLFTRRELVCYRCRSVFSGMPISRRHAAWENAVGERYPAPPAKPTPDTTELEPQETASR